ncbi:MAG TPA: hypothetical protein VHI13_02680 [Candidatus Kapabacteria bacterium]|nr:hypothetical protein [Candidatus Kapabacteria bacterium]
MRALAELQAPEAIEGLLPALSAFIDDDWFSDDLPQAYALLGPAAIPALGCYLGDAGNEERARLTAIDCLVKMADHTPAARDQCIAVLCSNLNEPRSQNAIFNGPMIMALMEMDGIEALETIRAAFGAGAVDINLTGDLEDVEIYFGVRAERSTPKPRYNNGLMSE